VADKARYPQIPSTVWWGVRSALNKTPSATLDERYLSVQLGVQEAAAKAYIAELIAVGILNEDKRATPLANKWRLDASYPEAASELIAKLYPEGLRHVAPPEEANRQKTIGWFQQEGFGTGAAGNKAATYFLIGSPKPNESPGRTFAKGAASESTPTKTSKPLKNAAEKKVSNRQADRSTDEATSGGIPLNLNLQIHISADAGADQIESIFSAMRRYLYAKQDS